jgi:hypothetical protein
MNINEQIKNTKTRDEFINFLKELQKDFQSNQDSWENKTIDSYFQALAAWTKDSDGYYKNQGQPIPENVNWKAVAEMLLAAKFYE